MRKITTFLILFGLLSPIFSFAQEPMGPPETLEEAKEMGKQVGKQTLEKLPDILKGIWEREILPAWRKMYNWAKNIWDSYIWPKIGSWLKKEIEERKPAIEEEFKKEKEEVKKEAPEIGKSIWERFKELFD
jgi:hypothetical protein